MAREEHLPPACAFALSVLQERASTPDEVPEEAVEAAEQHLATCIRCLSSPPLLAPPRKKRRVRRPEENMPTPAAPQRVETIVSPPHQVEPPGVTITLEELAPLTLRQPENHDEPAQATGQRLPAVLEPTEEPLDCTHCRRLLPDYAQALDRAENVAQLYPEMYTHLLVCDTGCPVLLDLLRQEARENRKYHRHPVRNPLGVIGWELSGFFRTGQVPIAPMALAYGTLILLLVVASFSALLAIRWDDARLAHLQLLHQALPTPDGVGLSDGLQVYDACNAESYQAKRQAARALQANDTGKAATLLSQAMSATATDTSGCNGAEAAIYRADLQVRASGHPFGLLVIAFDSGPGRADPAGGSDRHTLYAAYTQELVGSYIAQQQYNSAQMRTPTAPLLYLVLANTTGNAQGALQIANALAALATPAEDRSGLLVTGHAPLLGVVGLAPDSLLLAALPVLCRAGVPVISPTATGLFLVNQLTGTSLYRHCAQGFAFARFSADDAAQSAAAANYAYSRLGARNVALFYDPGSLSSQETAQYFLTHFRQNPHSRVVAQETAVSAGLPENDTQATTLSILQNGLSDALQARPRPDLIFASLPSSDVITLARAIAQLPAGEQPALMIDGEFVHPSALQELGQWARQQQLTLPHIYIALASAARPPTNAWQKQFYASFCSSFARPGSICSGAAALDQGALLFADSVEMVSLALGTTDLSGWLPARFVQKLGKEHFAGVSGPVNVEPLDNVLIISHSTPPVILGVQDDGSLQIAG